MIYLEFLVLIIVHTGSEAWVQLVGCPRKFFLMSIVG